MQTMQPLSLLIWCNSGFSPEGWERLRREAAPHRVEDAFKSPHGLPFADVAFGQPDPDALRASATLRWAHITSAGYTRYDRADLRETFAERGAFLTNSSHVYDEPCAQHALAFLLSLARQLPQALDRQREAAPQWETGARREASFLLDPTQTVLLLGYGAIGKRLTQLLAPFGMTVVAVRRTPKPQSSNSGGGVREVSEADGDTWLGRADHVINLLPESQSTVGYVGAARLAAMKSGAFFFNIGRGATVDQDALIAALESGQLGGAYLDVTSPEPLPPDHRLWTAPRCWITPHSAGGFIGEEARLIDHFLANLRAFTRNEPLTDRVL